MDYINALLPSTQIDENETIENSSPDFLKKLGELLAKTSKRTIANYLMWKATEESIDQLPKTLRKRQEAFKIPYENLEVREVKRWQKCLGETVER